MTNVVSFPGLGLEFELNRVAVEIFGRPIYWYGIIIATGMLLAVFLCGKVMDAVKTGPFSVTTLYAQLKRVKRITQIDPYRSWGLGLLIKWLREEEKANDRSRNERKNRPSL